MLRFLAMFAKDLSDETEDYTLFDFEAPTWVAALAKAEQHAAKIGMELDSLARQA